MILEWTTVLYLQAPPAPVEALLSLQAPGWFAAREPQHVKTRPNQRRALYPTFSDEVWWQCLLVMFAGRSCRLLLCDQLH